MSDCNFYSETVIFISCVIAIILLLVLLLGVMDDSYSTLVRVIGSSGPAILIVIIGGLISQYVVPRYCKT